MKIAIKLNKSNGDRGNGYEIVVYCNHLRNRKQKVIGYSKVNHFNEEMQLVNEKHPDYEELLPRLMDLKIKARKLIATGCTDVVEAMQYLFDEKPQSSCFIQFCEDYLSELKSMANEAEKRGDIQRRNRIMGNHNANRNSLRQFKKFYPKINFDQLNYNVIMRFRKQYESAGASNMTVLHYIRQLRAMYNKGVRKLNIVDTAPFNDTLDGLKQRSYDARKKYIDISAIKLLENYKTDNLNEQKIIHLFLLQFYFGGCDLIDLYFLPRSSQFKDRIIIERSKTEQTANLKVHPKAKKILDLYKCDSGDWFFPWSKDIKSYETFRRYYQLVLTRVQKRHEIKVLPTGGNLSVKVARHTFGNRAKQLLIDSEIIRELMAHQRNDIDNFYKDKFSEEVRDKALFKIITTDNIEKKV